MVLTYLEPKSWCHLTIREGCLFPSIKLFDRAYNDDDALIPFQTLEAGAGISGMKRGAVKVSSGSHHNDGHVSYHCHHHHHHHHHHHTTPTMVPSEWNSRFKSESFTSSVPAHLHKD